VNIKIITWSHEECCLADSTSSADWEHLANTMTQIFQYSLCYSSYSIIMIAQIIINVNILELTLQVTLFSFSFVQSP